MLERSKLKVNLDDIVSDGIKFISKTELTAVQERKNGLRSNQPRKCSLNETSNSSDDVNMTRGTRTRRPRIQVFQSGYCAICNVPYNCVEDHIQSKKHQKLIGQNANYIAVNGYIHSDVGLESLLKLNGIDAIGFGNEFVKSKSRSTMPKAKTSDRRRTSSASPTRNDSTGHHLRSRKNVNYSCMTPPMEEDTMPVKPDLEPPKSPVRLQYKEYRELRSSTRALAKLTSVQDKEETEVWNSGRPKRACINRQKRISADERLVADNQAFYKVEVLSSKLRSSVSRDRELPRTVKAQKQNNDNEKIIVKLKKMRCSELTQLNNEATNFLFPNRDESSEEDDEGENQTSMSEENETLLSSTSETEERKINLKCELEDESMDSISSEVQRKRKRRSQAEAFILDNQKYYKFETPGSRLRYHGSYLSPIPMKSNGECVPKSERDDAPALKKEVKEKLEINLDEYKFSFESVPVNQPWYQAFSRIDKGEQKYQFSSNYYWDDFVMPYQLPHIKSLDPGLCTAAHRELLESIQNFVNDEACSIESTETESCVDEPTAKELPSELTEDENSMLSCTTENSEITIVEEAPQEPKVEPKPLFDRKRFPRRRKGILLSPTSVGSRSRKSPRQHASTLAILSLLQKKKRSSKNSSQIPDHTLEPISEEDPIAVPAPVHTSTPAPKPKTVPKPVRAPPKVKRKDYFAIAAKIEEELDTALDCDLDYEIDKDIEKSFLDFKNSELNVSDILTIYDESKQKETEISCRRFFNGTPGRKGKRKKNLTGWPKTKKRKLLKLNEANENINTNLNIDSEDNYENDEDDDAASLDSINDQDINDKEETKATENETDTENSSRVGDNSSELKNRVLRNSELQPFVYVKKLDSSKLKSTIKLKSSLKNKRTSKRRRIIVSPKSPRILRKPRGKWYRER